MADLTRVVLVLNLLVSVVTRVDTEEKELTFGKTIRGNL